MANSNANNRGGSRPERVPVSGRRDVLTVADKDPAYVYRWVNDTQGRIDQFIKGGYEHVSEKHKVGQNGIDSSADVSSMTTNTSPGMVQYLMRIKREWYDEDREAAARKVDKTEADMKRTLNSGRDGTYGDVTIS